MIESDTYRYLSTNKGHITCHDEMCRGGFESRGGCLQVDKRRGLRVFVMRDNDDFCKSKRTIIASDLNFIANLRKEKKMMDGY